MAALPQAPPAAIGNPPLNEFLSAEENFAAERGMHPLQNWIFSTLIYYPLALDAHPRNALSLEVDWGAGLDKFALLSSATGDASKEETARDLLLQLESLLANGSGVDAALLVWTYFIQAIDRHLAEGADLPRLLQLLGGFLSCNISPLFQDAAAYCGCAMVSYWAVGMHKQPPIQVAAPAIIEFLGATAGLVDALGRKGLNLLKERTECLDPSCHPGFRAAALAYASCAVAMILQGTPAFPSRQEVLMDIIEAGFGLAPLFGAPPGELLSAWQLAALPSLLAVLRVPRMMVPQNIFGAPQNIHEVWRAMQAADMASQVEILAHCELIPGYLQLMSGLTEPFKVAVLEPEREGAALQAQKISEHLVMAAKNTSMLLGKGLQVDSFLQNSGIPVMLNYLSTYAQLQPALPWVHPAHVVAYEAASALMSVLQTLHMPQWRWHARGQQLLLDCGAAQTLLSVVDSAPSIMDAIKYYEGDAQDAARDRHAAASGQQEQHNEYRFAAIRNALGLILGLARFSLAGREALVQAGCANPLILRMAHLQKGLPLGAVERQSLPPMADRIVRDWTDSAIATLSELLSPPPTKEKGSEGKKKAADLGKQLFGQLKKLMAPAELLGLLRWCPQPGRPVEAFWATEGGNQDLADVLEKEVLNIIISMVYMWPGASKDLEHEEEFMQYMEEVLVNSNNETSRFKRRQRPLDVLATLTGMVRKSSSTHIVARLLRPGGPNGTPVVGVTLSMLGQAFNQGKKLERSLTGVLGLSRGLEAGAAAKEKSLKEADLAHYGNLAFGAAELLEALLGQNAPELQLEANRVKADMERLNLRQAATAVQASKLETLKVAGQVTLACINEVDELAELGRQRVQQKAAAVAAEAAADAAAAELLAAEEATQQASAAKASKRQRKKAAKQAQQAAAAPQQEEQEGQQQEERERRDREERDRTAQEKAQRAAEEAAAAQQAEREAAQRRAAAKAAKRQRKKAAKQAQQQAAGDSATGTVDATAASSAAPQPSSSAASVASPRAAAASPQQHAPFCLPQASQQGPAAPVPKSIRMSAQDSSQQQQQQGAQHEAGQAGQATGPQTPSPARVGAPAQVGTPQQTEALAPAEDDQDSEFQALLSLLIPGAVEPNTPTFTLPPI